MSIPARRNRRDDWVWRQGSQPGRPRSAARAGISPRSTQRWSRQHLLGLDSHGRTRKRIRRPPAGPRASQERCRAWNQAKRGQPRGKVPLRGTPSALSFPIVRVNQEAPEVSVASKGFVTGVDVYLEGSRQESGRQPADRRRVLHYFCLCCFHAAEFGVDPEFHFRSVVPRVKDVSVDRDVPTGPPVSDHPLLASGIRHAQERCGIRSIEDVCDPHSSPERRDSRMFKANSTVRSASTAISTVAAT